MKKYLEIAAILIAGITIPFAIYVRIHFLLIEEKASTICKNSGYLQPYGVVTIKNKKYAVCESYSVEDFPELQYAILKEIK